MKKDKPKIKDFTDLFAWEEARKLSLLIYKLTQNFPREEIYGLTNQLRRASISISSNIAESFGRKGYKEKIQFLYQAQGSILEVKSQIIISKDLSFISTADYNKAFKQIVTTHRLLQGLISKSKTFLNH